MIESSFRLDFEGCRRVLRERLAGPAPGLLQLVTGPRQVGKTTMLLQLQSELSPGAHYAAADSPEASLPGFWERLWRRLEQEAAGGRKTVLLLDEIHHLPNWSRQLKGEWDRVRRRKLPIHVVATGSSALGLGTGARESLAGRFERVTLSHWSASALARTFHLPPAEAALTVVQRGAYPGAMPFRSDPPRWSAYVRDSIVEPAIGRDVLSLARVRRPALLRQVFATAVSLPAQIVSLQKMQGRLQDGGALETIAAYLELLQDAYLVAALEKFAGRGSRARSAPPKLVPLSNAFPAALDPRGIPGPDSDPQRFGIWLENACLAFAWNSGQQLWYWREEPQEVDAVLEGSWGQWAIEVKTGAFEASALGGLLEFVRRYPPFRPLVVCGPPGLLTASRLGVPAMLWTEFLLRGPPSS